MIYPLEETLSAAMRRLPDYSHNAIPVIAEENPSECRKGAHHVRLPGNGGFDVIDIAGRLEGVGVLTRHDVGTLDRSHKVPRKRGQKAAKMDRNRRIRDFHLCLYVSFPIRDRERNTSKPWSESIGSRGPSSPAVSNDAPRNVVCCNSPMGWPVWNLLDLWRYQWPGNKLGGPWETDEHVEDGGLGSETQDTAAQTGLARVATLTHSLLHCIHWRGF